MKNNPLHKYQKLTNKHLGSNVYISVLVLPTPILLVPAALMLTTNYFLSLTALQIKLLSLEKKAEPNLIDSVRNLMSFCFFLRASDNADFLKMHIYQIRKSIRAKISGNTSESGHKLQ